MKHLVLIVLMIAVPAGAAVHHSKRSNAYFEQHGKCRAAQKSANAEAKKHPKEERTKLQREAREAYKRCEEYAHLVWQYYPAKPPVPDPTATSTAAAGTTHE